MSRRGAARRRSGTLLLAALVLALGYVNWQVAELEVDISPAAAQSEPADGLAPPALEPPPEPQPLTAFDEIIRRPLFSAGRLPPAVLEEGGEAVAEEAAGEAAEPPPPELQLIGVAIDGGTRQALLRSPEAGEDWVREGDSIGGWRVDKVGAEAVVLGSGERSLRLSLYPGGGADEGQ